MIELMMQYLDRRRDVVVTTFCEWDEKGIAPRALYKKLGFIEGELFEEFNYPQQKFILQIYNHSATALINVPHTIHTLLQSVYIKK